jgi:site-specific recombinase XerD
MMPTGSAVPMQPAEVLFRLAFTTLCLEGRATPKVVQSMLGQAALDMTMRVYAKATDRSMRDAINALPFATATAPAAEGDSL